MRISDWSSDVCSSDLLFLDRADQMRMAVAERIDRDARSEIEEAAAVVGNQIDALASHRPHVAPRVDGHERRDGHRKGLLIPKAKGSPDGHPAALLGLARVRRTTAPNGAPAKAGAQQIGRATD